MMDEIGLRNPDQKETDSEKFETFSRILIRKAKTEIMKAAGTKQAGEPIIDGKNLVELISELNNSVKIIEPGNPIENPETDFYPTEFCRHFGLMESTVDEVKKELGID